METLKNTCKIIAVTLQFSASCFSQDSLNAKIDQSGNPSNAVFKMPTSVEGTLGYNKVLFPLETENKSFLDRNFFQFNAPGCSVELNISYSFSGQKENNGLSTDETSTKQQKGSADLTPNASQTFSDLEIIKLVKYIKELEDLVASNDSKQSNGNAIMSDNSINNKNLSDNAIADFVNQLSDGDLAKLAIYIKDIEKAPRSKEILNENEYAELFASTDEILTLKEYTLKEQLIRQGRLVTDNNNTN